MTRFFTDDPATDETYRNVQTGSDRFPRPPRDFVEELWSRYEPYADAEFPALARTCFHPRFWEMYLGCSLLEGGRFVVPRERRRTIHKGPDLQLENDAGWIEAIAVTPGEGADAVEEGPSGKERSVPDDRIILRLLAGIGEKRRKYDGYLCGEVVRPNEPYVIAINAALVPSARSEQSIPRIVRAVYPFGYEQIHFDTRTLDAVGRSFQYRDTIYKLSGADVSTRIFEDPHFAGISGVLYSAVDVWNYPSPLAGDFVLVHNELATNPIPRGFLRAGLECWVENQTLTLSRQRLAPDAVVSDVS